MAMTVPKTIGVNNGFLSENGKLFLQVRTQNSWMGQILEKSFDGSWELNGGQIKEEDISKALTLPVMAKQAVKNAEEKLGLKMDFPGNPITLFTSYENKEKGIVDWAFTFVIRPGYWDIGQTSFLRDVMLVGVEDLNRIANFPEGKGQLVSGWGNRQHRMSLGVLAQAPHHGERILARRTLSDIKPNWRETEMFENAGEALKFLREEIGL
jgi:hypothetical protein